MNIFKFKRNVFDLASLKLSLFYVAIVMFISIGFSISLYRISFNEINRGLGSQAQIYRDISIDQFIPRSLLDIESIRQHQIRESSARLRFNLIYFNLLILILSSVLSYFLARKTLGPIEESMEAQNRFTADASHELRTPLTAMKTEIEVTLRDKKISLGKAVELLNSNLEEIGKLESLSNALLKLARFREKTKESFELTSLKDTMISAYEKVESLAMQKQITFKNELANIKIKGDKQSLVELFVILLDNAIKYSPRESKISLSIKREGSHAYVKIKDQGVGIKASDLPYIFNRFYRADNSRSKDEIPGYGLGLSIAKQIVDLHDGSILANSKPGKGSEFVVKF